MVSYTNPTGRSYEDIFADALSRVLLYSPEWTNFNRSDPGVTILQNLSAFTSLQQAYAGEITDEIMLGLLSLLGYEPSPVHPASLLASPEPRGAYPLPAFQKFFLGGLCFETVKAEPLRPWSLAAAYACDGQSWRDITCLLDGSNTLTAAVFGAEPREGLSFCCVLRGKIDKNESLTFYAGAADEKQRNPFLAGDDLSFAETEWQYYTAGGWVRAQAEDDTRCFLNSGAICLTLTGGAPVVFTGAPVSGFAVRCVLRRAEYDIAPRVCSFYENLILLRQQNTKAATFSFAGGGSVRLSGGASTCENRFVYCRESTGRVYRAYAPYAGQSGAGRYYLEIEQPDGTMRIVFDKKRFGFAPESGAEAVRVVCYDSVMLHHRLLGSVTGCENQLFTVASAESLIAEGFRLIVEQKKDGEEPAYYFTGPRDKSPHNICYEVLPAQSAVNVLQNGLAGECRLYLCDCAVTAGAAGNLRAGAQLTPPEDLYAKAPSVPALYSPGPGRGGSSRETPEQLRRRFAAEMKRACSAVLLSDYEELVRQTPGLCIHKVHASADAAHNLIKIAVKPCGEARFPRLSPVYLRQIRRYLEPRRMICTQIELLQPEYVTIHVTLALSVQNYYENMREKIEALLARELDFITTGRGFGETVYFASLYQKLQALPGVESIYRLKLKPSAFENAAASGEDIQLGSNCLCCLGGLSLEINSF